MIISDIKKMYTHVEGNQNSQLPYTIFSLFCINFYLAICPTLLKTQYKPNVVV